MEAQERTAIYDRFRLFFGVCADDAVETYSTVGYSVL